MSQDKIYLFASPYCSERDEKKRILLAIPMYMYKVLTYDFHRGLNFFQLSILRFMVRPGIHVSTISEMLGFNERLIYMVLGELQAMGLVDSNLFITEKGRIMLNEADGFIIDKSKTRTGYLFQFADRNELYPYYMDAISQTTCNDGKINVNLNLADEDFYEAFHVLNCSKKTLPMPTERDVCECIHNVTRLDSGVRERYSSMPDYHRFRARIESPKLVYVCTYIYMKQADMVSGCYEPEWHVADPFGMRDSSLIRFYIQSVGDNALRESIKDHFADFDTIEKTKYREQEERKERFLNDEIQDRLDMDFHRMNENLQGYLRDVMWAYHCMDVSSYRDVDASNQFVRAVSYVYENILYNDENNVRPDVYEQVNQIFFQKEDLKKDRTIVDKINALRRDHCVHVYALLTGKTNLPSRIYTVAKGWDGREGLLQKLTAVLLTYEDGKDNSLSKLFAANLDDVIRYSYELGRNSVSHGNTQKQICLDQDTVKETYEFLIKFINQYIQLL